MAGAPVGNENSSRENRLWGNTIRRAAVQDAERMRRIAEKLLTMAELGDVQAMKEIGDRLDGKPKQTVAGDEDMPLKMLIGWMEHSK
jgi:ribosomal protein L17